jgi:hypothetical protein
MRERGRERVDWLVETAFKFEKKKPKREGKAANWMVEKLSKREADNSRWEVIDWLIEIVSKRDFCEGRREVIYWLIKTFPET